MVGRKVAAEPGRTVIMPGAAIINRRDRQVSRQFFDQENDKVPVKISPELAPKPIDDTAFYGMGRSPLQGGAGAMTTVYHSLAIEEWTSIQQPWFIMPKVPGAIVVGSPRGAQLPLAPRPNIERPGQTTYGATATLRPAMSLSPRYWALLGG